MSLPQDFIGFRYGPYHSSDLKLILVSSSNRYQKNLLPPPTDYTADINGGSGKYYYGQTFKEREIKVNVAFTNIDEITFRRLAQIFSTDKLQDLVFDEQPYKIYRAKCKTAPDFKFVCFKDPYSGERIYKGEGTINFVCYHPFAYCFNKYLITAADSYKCEIPQLKLNPKSIYNNPYKFDAPPKQLTGEIKSHYNINGNMGEKWDGGYPTIDQVQWGELYAKNGENEEILNDIRRYWDNIPLWQGAAQLLTSPTLDYEQELIYLPQYCKTNFYNMETGINKQNAMIGTRLLVYNPGDLSVDLTLYLNNIKNKLRDVDEPYRFRISRYNVQRLTIEQSVDWTLLKTYDPMEEETFKYGTRYVNLIEADKNAGVRVNPQIRHLKNSHPNHLYFAEPVPRDRLAYYLKIFVYQTYQRFIKLKDEKVGDKYIFSANNSNIVNPTTAITYMKNFYKNELQDYLNTYQENYDACIDDTEKFELYWEALIHVLTRTFEELEEALNYRNGLPSRFSLFDTNYTLENYIYDFIHNPLEYITVDSYRDYGDFTFNAVEQMNFITEDYLEIEVNNTKKEFPNNLILDFEKRLVYNEIEDEDSAFKYKVDKYTYNDYIVAGKWFQIPPGWSLIEITPVLLEELYPGKRWRDARPFQWGTMKEYEKKTYNRCEQLAAIKYLAENCPRSFLEQIPMDDSNKPCAGASEKTVDEIKNILTNELYNEDDDRPALGEQDYKLEEYLQFRRWYEGNKSYEHFLEYPNGLLSGIWKSKLIKTEFNFLKLLNDYWRLAHLDENGYPAEDAEDWWWHANNYLWENFPPVYWSYVDILNEIKVEYTPEYY